MHRVSSLMIMLALLSTTPAANAQGRGKGKQNHNDGGEQAVQNDRNTGSSTVSVDVSIGKGDQRVIHDWFSRAADKGVLPPGLAKKEQLPPGLQKQLARNGQLPPGLQKRVQPLPPALEARLTRLPEGRKRVILNGSVILLDERKNLILDMMAVF